MSSQNPIGSSTMSDLLFNAGNLDRALHSKDDFWQDRFGIQRITYSHIERKVDNIQNLYAQGSGAGKIGYLVPGTDKNVTVKDILDERVYGVNFNVNVDGITDTTVALQKALDYSYLINKPLELPGGTYLISNDIFIRREIIPMGPIKFISLRNGDNPPSYTVYFERRYIVDGIDFEYVNICFRPRNGENFILAKGGVENCVLINSCVSFGQDKTITRDYICERNSFIWKLSRAKSGVEIINACNVVVGNNTFLDMKAMVEIIPTISYASDNIIIKNNRGTALLNGVIAKGTSSRRITNLVLDNNTIIGSTRDAPSITNAGINISFGCDITIRKNKIIFGHDNIKLYSCIGVTIEDDNSLYTTTIMPNIRAMGCVDLVIKDGYFETNWVQAYNILILDNAKNGQDSTGNYLSKNIHIKNNKFKCKNRSVKIEVSEDVKVYRNEFEGEDINTLTGVVWFTTSKRCVEFKNTLRAKSGPVIKNDIGLELLTSESDTGMTVISDIIPVVASPIITEQDSDLDNAKTYLISISNTVAKSIKTNIGTKKPLSAWMNGVTAQVAWNGCAWNTTTGNTGDLVTNGAPHDNYGTEEFHFSKSAVVIDKENVLTCRDFYTPDVSDNYPLDILSKQFAEKSWQTAFFRCPLIVDGVIYDPVATGLSSQTGWTTQLSARCCLGQKRNGTYVLLVVDGKTNISGTTMVKCAQKLLALGCYNAFNLDGGGSATLWYQGSVINSPSDAGGERAVPHVFYI